MHSLELNADTGSTKSIVVKIEVRWKAIQGILSP